MSYTTRNPNFVTADFITAGSGLLSYYVPPNEGENFIVDKLFASIVAKKDNTTVKPNTTFGDTSKQNLRGKVQQ